VTISERMLEVAARQFAILAADAERGPDEANPIATLRKYVERDLTKMEASNG
jgi:hypothetical protein